MKKYEKIADYLTRFLADEVRKTGLQKVVVGLSGGIDSAVVAVLAQRAFGDDLLCIKMPSHYSSQNSLDDADALCKDFHLRAVTKSIAPMLQAYEAQNPDMNNLRRGNLSARLRMVTLFDMSAKESALVLGTSNKSELMLGYGTLYGDLASALNPIGDLYKSEIFEFAQHLGVTKSIIEKPPSADLWDGQSDEADLGYSYEKLDKALRLYVEERLSLIQIIECGIDKEMLEMIVKKFSNDVLKLE